MTPITSDKPQLRDLIAAIVRQLFPAAANPWGPYEYRVVAVDAGRLTLVAVKPGGAPLQRVDVWAGLPGGGGVPVVGSSVAVAFLDGDTARPAVLAFLPSRLTGGVPTSVSLDASALVSIGASAAEVHVAGGDVSDATGLGRVVRYGDPILFGAPGQGTVSPGVVLNHFSKVKT